MRGENKEKADKRKIEKRWERERRKFFKDRGIECKEMEKRRNGERYWVDRTLKREKEMQRAERYKRIRCSEYTK